MHLCVCVRTCSSLRTILNKSPSAADIENLLKEAGVKGDSAKAAAVVAACQGKEFHTLVQEGLKAMSTMGGSSSAPAPSASSAPAKKEEKVVEAPKEEEVDVDMGSLWD